MGGGDAQRPVWRVNEPKKMGAQRMGAYVWPKPTSFFIKRLGVLWIFSKRSVLLKKIDSFQVYY
jgi:hypothetical protein